MEKAIDDGYKIEIIRGYKFERAKIFEGYVDALYKLRQEYPSGTPDEFNRQITYEFTLW